MILARSCHSCLCLFESRQDLTIHSRQDEGNLATILPKLQCNLSEFLAKICMLKQKKHQQEGGLVFVLIDKIYQILKTVLHWLSKDVKNTPLCVVFSTFFSMFGYPDETLSPVLDILLSPKLLRQTPMFKNLHFWHKVTM